jgi:predicted nucleotidyltransferase
MNTHMVEGIHYGLSDTLLKSIVEVIVRRVHPSRILLFGSRARGNYTSTSDIDIAVDCGEDDFHVQVIEEEIRTLLKLDILHLHKANKRLQEEIAAAGIVLYEGTK